MNDNCKIIAEDVKNATVIECSPDVGLMGNIMGWLMVEELKMEEIGYMDSEFFPPLAVIRNGLSLKPSRVYKKNDIVLFLSDFSIPQPIMYDMTKSMVDWMEKNNTKKFFTFNSILTQKKTGTILAIANNDNSMEKLKRYNLEPLFAGSLNGLSGTLLTQAAEKNIPGICILAETLNNYPDPRAAASIVDVFNEILDINIDNTQLLKEAELIEARLKKLADQVSKEPDTAMYM